MPNHGIRNKRPLMESRLTTKKMKRYKKERKKLRRLSLIQAAGPQKEKNKTNLLQSFILYQFLFLCDI